MAQAKRRKGEKVPAQLRRIGDRHAVIVPHHEVQIIDMVKVDEQVRRATTRLADLETERLRVQAVLADLVAQRQAFDALPIDRDEDDPKVDPDPVPAPAPAPVLAPDTNPKRVV